MAFFIGGQVNCSTTIHSNTDVMRVLSTSGTSDLEESEAKPKPQPAARSGSSLPSARRALMKAFGVRVAEPLGSSALGDAGMEQKVLERMEGRALDTQMKEFYTAYSKVRVHPSLRPSVSLSFSSIFRRISSPSLRFPLTSCLSLLPLPTHGDVDAHTRTSPQSMSTNRPRDSTS